MRRTLVCVVLFLAALTTTYAASDYILTKGDPAAKVGYFDPKWSPNGRMIAYTQSNHYDPKDIPEYGDLYLAHLDHGSWKHKLFAKLAFNQVWTSDNRLAYAIEGAIMLYNPRSGRINQIKRSDVITEKCDGHEDYPKGFSRDGRFMAFERAFMEGGELRIYDLKRHRDLGLRIDDESGWAFSPTDDRILGLISPDVMKDQQLPSNRMMLWDLQTLKWRIVLRRYNVSQIDWQRRHNRLWVYIDNPWESDLPEYRPHDLKPPAGVGWYRFDLQTRRLKKENHEQSGELTADQEKYISTLDTIELGNFHQADWGMDTSPDQRSLAYVTKSGDIIIHRFD